MVHSKHPLAKIKEMLDINDDDNNIDNNDDGDDDERERTLS